MLQSERVRIIFPINNERFVSILFDIFFGDVTTISASDGIFIKISCNCGFVRNITVMFRFANIFSILSFYQRLTFLPHIAASQQSFVVPFHYS